MAGKGLYQTQVQRTFCPSPTSSYWKYLRDEADVERRMAVQREARLALQRSGIPSVNREGEMLRPARMPHKWTEDEFWVS